MFYFELAHVSRHRTNRFAWQLRSAILSVVTLILQGLNFAIPTILGLEHVAGLATAQHDACLFYYVFLDLFPSFFNFYLGIFYFILLFYYGRE
jgi:hypothetical protein